MQQQSVWMHVRLDVSVSVRLDVSVSVRARAYVSAYFSSFLSSFPLLFYFKELAWLLAASNTLYCATYIKECFHFPSTLHTTIT